MTGAAGFIGSAVAARLAQMGWQVHGCDNFNNYYDPQLKRDRVAALLTPLGVRCEEIELADPAQVSALFERSRPSHVIHLAAQAGVRYSMDHPAAYVQFNLVGFANMLEACRHCQPGHLVYASSSSVYGTSTRLPFREDACTDTPISFYAATKKANEAMAHAYSHLYGLPATGLRLFTVYGPWGRPDMAYYHFASNMLRGVPIPVYAEGQLLRDFTYIDDIVEAIVRLLVAPPQPGGAAPPHRIVNIGNRQPVMVRAFISALERVLDVPATLRFLPMQPGDVTATCADTTRLHELVGWAPDTSLETGLQKFASWFLNYHA